MTNLLAVPATTVFDEPVLISPMSPLVMLAFFGTAAAVAVIVAASWAWKRRDWLPLACCLGAAACALNEPIFDVLGKIVYADNNFMAFTVMGRHIPWFLVIGYIPWVGLLPYMIARGMASGWRARNLYAISIAGVLSVALTEFINTFIHAWKYYGDTPLQFFGGVAAMACVPLAGGFLLYALAFPLRGLKRILAGFFIPLVTLPMMFAGVGLPLYLALYANTSLVVRSMAILVLFVFIAITNIGIVQLTEFRQRLSEGEAAAREFVADRCGRDAHNWVQVQRGEQLRFGSRRGRTDDE